jgi:hypothetical protein
VKEDTFTHNRELATRARFEVSDKKALEYAENGNRLFNFEYIGGLTGDHPSKSLLTYSAKHFIAIARFIREWSEGRAPDEIDGKHSEPIEGRIDDLQNYMDLLRAMIQKERLRPIEPEP